MGRRVEILAFETERVTQYSVVTECPVCLSPTELLTPSQAAAMVQVEPQVIDQWLAEGASHGVTTPGGQTRVCKRSLMRSC